MRQQEGSSGRARALLRARTREKESEREGGQERENEDEQERECQEAERTRVCARGVRESVGERVRESFRNLDTGIFLSSCVCVSVFDLHMRVGVYRVANPQRMPQVAGHFSQKSH